MDPSDHERTFSDVFLGGQRFSMAGSKLAVFFNYLNEIKANIIVYNHKNHIFYRKKFEVIFIRLI